MRTDPAWRGAQRGDTPDGSEKKSRDPHVISCRNLRAQPYAFVEAHFPTGPFEDGDYEHSESRRGSSAWRSGAGRNTRPSVNGARVASRPKWGGLFYGAVIKTLHLKRCRASGPAVVDGVHSATDFAGRTRRSVVARRTSSLSWRSPLPRASRSRCPRPRGDRCLCRGSTEWRPPATRRWARR